MRELDPELAGTFLVGAFMESLVGLLAPDRGGDQARMDAVADAIAAGGPGTSVRRSPLLSE